MIELKISHQDEKVIEQCAEVLLKSKLAMDLRIEKNIVRLELKGADIVSTPMHLLTAKTKALLFTNVENKIKATFPGSPPEVYSLPIVNMDWDQVQHLQEELQRV